MGPKPAAIRSCSLVAVLACSAPVLSGEQDSVGDLEERLRRLEQHQAELERQIEEKDRRIRALEEAAGLPPAVPPPIESTPPAVPESAPAAATAAAGHQDRIGEYAPRAGFILGDTRYGKMNLKLITYARYLNQTGLDDTFTDSFGTTTSIDTRQDIQLNKATIQFYGWLLDPKFKYLLYVWSSNPSQGQGAQVVVGGFLSYTFNEHLMLGAGINALPGVRSTEGTYPIWLTMDNRLIADEFFRPSFTQGIWARGHLTKSLEYYVQMGNNMSALGVDAAQLDNEFNTWSARLAWMPTTSEFGTQSGNGDFDFHEELATRFGIHMTRSREDAQSQPNTDNFENVTIRLSDGNSIFEPFLFGPGVVVRQAQYQMVSLDAAAKYRGWSLEGEFYWRDVDDFNGPGTEVVPPISDNGFQLQASTMVIPKLLQVYAGYSKIFGQNGDPWDARVGVNLFPFRNQVVRWNTEVLYLNRSPVGGLSLPTVVGGNGTVFYTSLLLDL